MDWFGVQSHGIPRTRLLEPDAVAGVAGLINVRRFLDEHGYTTTPLFLNEGSFEIGIGEEIQAQYVAETYVLARTLGVNLRGWIYFDLFGKDPGSDEGIFGLMSSLNEANQPLPRKAWAGLQAMIRSARLFDYEFEETVSGGFNDPAPFIQRFSRPGRSSSKLWVTFVPRVGHEEPGTRDVVIRVSPDTPAAWIDMYGAYRFVAADSTGNVKVRSTAEPAYLVADISGSP